MKSNFKPRDRSRTARAKAETLRRKGERAARRFTRDLAFTQVAEAAHA